MSLHQSANNLLDQLCNVIVQLSDDQFTKPLPILSGSSIGQHVRHSLEFFICLIDAKSSGKINYDNRKHDQFIEQEVALARSIIGSIKEFLNKEAIDVPLQMEACYELNATDIVTVNSSFNRELAYNIEHTIHHMALIKIGIKEAFSQVVLPEYFGVASSTVRYQKGNRTE